MKNMKMFFRYGLLFVLLLALVSSSFLVGCNNSQDEESTGEENTSGEESMIESEPQGKEESTGEENTSGNGSEESTGETGDESLASDDESRAENSENSTGESNTSNEESRNENSSTGGNTSGGENTSGNGTQTGGQTGSQTGSQSGFHTHKYTKTVVKPTCTEKGYTKYVCSCGDSYTGDETKALGHDTSGIMTVISEPTDTTPGKGSVVCGRCGQKVQVEIPVLTNKYAQLATPELADLLAERTAYYINQFRDTPAKMLKGKALDYANLRAEQLAAKSVMNYENAHNTADIMAANTQLKFGEWIDATEYGDPAEMSYYNNRGGDAIVYGGWSSNTIDEVAYGQAESLYNSPGHWEYVGSYTYMAIGCRYSTEQDQWDTLVFMTNTDEYDKK